MEESDCSMSSLDPSAIKCSEEKDMQSDQQLPMAEVFTSDITSDSDPSTSAANNTLTSLTPDPDLSQTDLDMSYTPLENQDSGNTEAKVQNCSCHSEESMEESSPNKRRKTNPESIATDWHLNKCFDRYWQHYFQSMAWCQRHFQLMNCMVQNMNTARNTHFSYPFNPFMQPGMGRGRGSAGRGQGRGQGFGRGQNNQPQSTQRKQEKRKPGRRRGKRKKKGAKTETESEVLAESDDSEVYEMELTNEMIEFFAHSEEHRRKRDASKEIIGEDGQVQKRVQIEEVKENKKAPTVEAPSERPGVRRTIEMTQLYGKGAAMIHGMETAIQMTYDRTMDIKQPKFWPNMPLKIVFS